jgi:hypothetical protein
MPVLTVHVDANHYADRSGEKCLQRPNFQRNAIIISVFEQCLAKLFHFLKIFLNLVTVNNSEFPVIFESHGKSSGEAAKH